MRNTDQRQKIIFFGTSYFVAPVLEKLKEFSNVIGIVKAGEEFDASLLKQADVAVVGSYGKIIPKAWLTLPRMGFLNIHPSLLPKYRGPSPVPYTLLNDEKETGVTIIQMDEKVDHGPILAQERTPVQPDELFHDLIVRLWIMGADLLIKTLASPLHPVPQDDSQATFTKLMKKEDGKIDLYDDPKLIFNKFRAYHEWPGLWFLHNPPERSASSGRAGGKRVKILDYKPGQIITVQPEGKKPMSLRDFENGYGPLLLRD